MLNKSILYFKQRTPCVTDDYFTVFSKKFFANSRSPTILGFISCSSKFLPFSSYLLTT